MLECGEKGALLHCSWDCKLVQPLWRRVWRFLQRLKLELPYDPATPLLGICLGKNTAALFIIVKAWKQPKCPSAEEWFKGMWCIYIYNEVLLSHKKAWNCAICNNVDGPRDYLVKSEKDKYQMISLICDIYSMIQVSESHSVVSNCLWPHGLYSPWNSPGQNIGVGSHSLLQRIFPTQVSNPGLLHCRQILYQLNLQGSPDTSELIYKMETDSQTWKTIHGSNLWLPKVEGRRRIN